MTVGTNFVRGANPVWSLVDLNGLQFDDTYYMYVLENQIPYIPATVYHDDSGTIPWTNPIRFLANGTLPIDIFFDETQVYRLEFRQNLGLLPPSQNDPLIYLVENYVPSGSIPMPGTIGESTTNNQISNGQFSLVNFTSPLVLTAVTNPDPIEIAPGWFLELTGTGSITIQQVLLDSSSPNPGNAPYALNLNIMGGWTNAPILRQRFQQNGINWANKFVSTIFTGLINGAGAQVTVRLVASNGQPLGVLVSAFLTTSFQPYPGNIFIPSYVNTDIPPDAYIDYEVLLPVSGNIYLTSFQLIASDSMGNLDYEQDTIDRQIDHLFHYYKPKLEYKPIPSFLVGWDFPLNPAQINGSTVATAAIGANKSQYAWDQTIVFQSVNSGVSVARSAAGALQLTAALAGQMAVIQYLDIPQVTKLLNGSMSVFISSATNNSVGYIATVSLYYTDAPNLPDVSAGTNNSLVATLGPTGIPATFNGSWTAVPRGTLGPATFLVSQGFTDQPFNNVMFSGWNLLNGTTANSATFFAIVIGFEPMVLNDVIDINCVGLCEGDIATKPAPKTQDEVLRDCERYYEQSYDLEVQPTAVTNVNALCKAQQGSIPVGGSPLTSLQVSSFDFEYRTLKRVSNPTLSIYSPVTGTVGNVAGSARGNTTPVTRNIILTSWTITNGNKYTNFVATQTNLFLTTAAINATTAALCYITFHYVSDARLGIVN